MVHTDHNEILIVDFKEYVACTNTLRPEFSWKPSGYSQCNIQSPYIPSPCAANLKSVEYLESHYKNLLYFDIRLDCHEFSNYFIYKNSEEGSNIRKYVKFPMGNMGWIGIGLNWDISRIRQKSYIPTSTQRHRLSLIMRYCIASAAHCTLCIFRL